jgi:hypothetical protein
MAARVRRDDFSYQHSAGLNSRAFMLAHTAAGNTLECKRCRDLPFRYWSDVIRDFVIPAFLCRFSQAANSNFSPA